MILVTGATGHIGRELVVQLVTSGQPTRALTRAPIRAMFDRDVEVIQGDLDDVATLPAALRHVECVVVLANGNAAGIARVDALITAAKKAGVRRLVKLSAIGPAFGLTDPISQRQLIDEETVRESGLEWTILRPNSLMTDLCFWSWPVRMENTVYATTGDPGAALVHPRDVAAVAVEAMTGDSHAGKTYLLTGRETLTPREQAACLEAALGRNLDYVEETVESSRARLIARGWCGDHVDALFEFKRQSAECGQKVVPALEHILDTAPLSLVDWVNENINEFR